MPGAGAARPEVAVEWVFRSTATTVHNRVVLGRYIAEPVPVPSGCITIRPVNTFATTVGYAARSHGTPPDGDVQLIIPKVASSGGVNRVIVDPLWKTPESLPEIVLRTERSSAIVLSGIRAHRSVANDHVARKGQAGIAFVKG